MLSVKEEISALPSDSNLQRVAELEQELSQAKQQTRTYSKLRKIPPSYLFHFIPLLVMASWLFSVYIYGYSGGLL